MAATLVSGVAVVAALTELRDVLAAVVDPEIPVLTIADLGILRDITGAGGSEVIVTITPTYSRCYAGGGGGYSTAEDLLRFDRALRSNALLSPAFTRFFFTGFEGDPSAGPLDGGVGFAGGGPGINAVLEMEFDEDITVIVLSNYDPPAAEELGSPIMQMVRGMD